MNQGTFSDYHHGDNLYQWWDQNVYPLCGGWAPNLAGSWSGMFSQGHNVGQAEYYAISRISKN